MKAIIEIELSFDGRWNSSKRDALINSIMANKDYGCWEVDDELLVSAESATCRLARSSKKKVGG